jgi:hypothetical protein
MLFFLGQLSSELSLSIILCKLGYTKFGAGLDMEPLAGMTSRDWAMLERRHREASQPIMPAPSM